MIDDGIYNFVSQSSSLSMPKSIRYFKTIRLITQHQIGIVREKLSGNNLRTEASTKKHPPLVC